MLWVAGRARDAAECRQILIMLGILPDPLSLGMHGRFRQYLAGCRCEACRAANAEMVRKARQRRAADPSRADMAGHGKAGTYKNHGCRCQPCRDAHNSWQNELNARKRAAA
jgi:hypothetical protein